MSTDIGKRLDAAIKAAGISQNELARRLKIRQSTISELVTGESAGSKHIVAIARELGQDPEWLQDGKGKMRNTRSDGADETVKKGSGKFVRDMTIVRIVGAIQAGVWLDAIEWPKHEQYELQLPIPQQYHGTPIVGLEVRGPSMDMVYPDGSFVVCAKFLDLGRRPRHGERVVALRFRDGEMEATIKEFRIDTDGQARLWPRSTHPQHQSPIDVVPGDDGVQVAYLVVGSYRPET